MLPKYHEKKFRMEGKEQQIQSDRNRSFFRRKKIVNNINILQKYVIRHIIRINVLLNLSSSICQCRV